MLSKSQAFCLGVIAIAYYYKITFSHNVEGGPVIETNQGKVRGTTLYSRGGRKFYGFMGIPYAKPPVGELRFEPPLTSDSWEGILDGTDFGPRCMQFDTLLGISLGSEDCLTINIFTPVEVKVIPSKSKRLPVLVYFHGGFFHNSGSDLFRSNYFMDEEIIFVTLNYRLAALGFLNTGDGAIRGNMGMKDQVLALRWIQDNIDAFGGDFRKVTLLGESAGGVCSHLHLFSSMSRGLFSKAISQSGSALHFWAVNNKDITQAQAIRYSKSVGCYHNDTTEMKACLKELDASQLVQAHEELLDPLRESIAIFKPSVEFDIKDGNTFLSQLPSEMVKRGDFAKVPWITGVNSDEGLIFSAAMLVNETIQTVAEEDWVHYLDRTLWLSTEPVTAEKIRHFYFNDGLVPEFNNGSPSTALMINMDPNQRLSSYTNMISDRGFFYDTHEGALMQSTYSPVYLFYYSYRGEWSVVNFIPDISGTFNRQLEVAWSLLSTWVSKNVFGRQFRNYGASHSDELSMLFYMPWVSEIYPESQDFEMSMDLVRLWVDFAHGESSLKFRNVEWPSVNATQEQPLQYLKIDSDPAIIDEPFTDRLEFWSTLLK